MKVSKSVKDARHAWLLALRSGRYKQGSGQLVEIDYTIGEEYPSTKTYGGFCCLGVAADVIMKDGIPFNRADDSGLRPDEAAKFGIKNVLVHCVTGELFDANKHNDSDRADIQAFLAEKNDEHEWSFKRIADYLETFWAKQDGL